MSAMRLPMRRGLWIPWVRIRLAWACLRVLMLDEVEKLKDWRSFEFEFWRELTVESGTLIFGLEQG